LIAALDCALEGMRVLVLGAGGSARAAAWALREAGAGEVSVWNRTPARARELAEDLGVRFAERVQGADLLVNCTSVGLRAEPSAEAALSLLGLDERKLAEYGYVADLAYRDGGTELLAAAARHGARTLDGLEVLVAQGALSFELWTGRPAPLEVMRRAVRDRTAPA
jgi:shikimate dehydrogenase